MLPIALYYRSTQITSTKGAGINLVNMQIQGSYISYIQEINRYGHFSRATLVKR